LTGGGILRGSVGRGPEILIGNIVALIFKRLEVSGALCGECFGLRCAAFGGGQAASRAFELLRLIFPILGCFCALLLRLGKSGAAFLKPGKRARHRFGCSRATHKSIDLFFREAVFREKLSTIAMHLDCIA
jgi:hypothetical protein